MRTKMHMSILLAFILSVIIFDTDSSQVDIVQAYPRTDIHEKGSGYLIVPASWAALIPSYAPWGGVLIPSESRPEKISENGVDILPQSTQKQLPTRTSDAPTLVIHSDEISIFPELLDTPQDTPTDSATDIDRDMPLQDAVLKALSEF